jgi:N6-L-threonylcarbamoyladenine synthase
LSCETSLEKSDSQELLLAIESSCDETAAAVIGRDLCIHSNVVASQDELHLRFGGVVPEIASRAHVRRILPVIDEALKRAEVTLGELSAIAVATQPGLVGSLLVGLTAAKTLALILKVPLIAVDHLAAHIYACQMSVGRNVFPALGFVISGGHTNLYDCQTPTEMKLLGSTIDDAVGEAFDKVAKILGLPYPGGPAVERTALSGNPKAFTFPRSFLKDANRLEFSFSGLKTAVLYEVAGTPGRKRPVPPLTEQRIADVAASFQEAAVEVLVGKCRQAILATGRNTLCVGGGVAANKAIRNALETMTAELDVELILAPREMCTDNAAMAGVAWEYFDRGLTSQLDLDVTPGLVRQ